MDQRFPLRPILLVLVLTPGVVGANVVVCFLSCFVGLAVTGATLGFKMFNLSVCFKLFTLSNVKNANTSPYSFTSKKKSLSTIQNCGTVH